MPLNSADRTFKLICPHSIKMFVCELLYMRIPPCLKCMSMPICLGYMCMWWDAGWDPEQKEVWPGSGLVSVVVYHLAHFITLAGLQINRQMLVYLCCHGIQGSWPTSSQISNTPHPYVYSYILFFLLKSLDPSLPLCFGFHILHPSLASWYSSWHSLSSCLMKYFFCHFLNITSSLASF